METETIESTEVTEATETTWTVKVVAYIPIEQTVEVTAASEEDAIGDAFDLALANPKSWQPSRSLESITEADLNAESCTSEDDDEEEGITEEE